METVSLTQIGHVVAALAVGSAVLASYRWIQRQSAVLGTIVAITVIGRCALGLALFWISYLGLPIAKSLQTSGDGFWQPVPAATNPLLMEVRWRSGDGFWRLAPDASGYYFLAADAADAATLVPLDHSVPSPLFVNTLALWMMAVGTSPAAAMFLNLCLYMALMVMLIRTFGPVNDWRRDLPCIIGVAAYSFSPVILFTSTQSLKDELSSVFVAMACLGVLALKRLIYRPPTGGHFWGPGVGVITVGIAIFGIAAVRWYFAFVVWGALGLCLAILAVRGRTTPLPRYLAGSVAVLLVGALAIWGGAGRYSDFWRSQSRVAQTSRIGFMNSGGATNIIMPIPHTLPEHAKATAAGLGVIFVPISLLRAISAVEIDGGRGLLGITDLDTLFMDAASVLALALLWRRRHAIADRLPVLVFGLILSAATAVLLGYIVTNFGTLWRMRPMVVIPLWVVGVIALSPRTEAPRESEEIHEAFPTRLSTGAWRLR